MMKLLKLRVRIHLREIGRNLILWVIFGHKKNRQKWTVALYEFYCLSLFEKSFVILILTFQLRTSKSRYLPVESCNLEAQVSVPAVPDPG